MPMPPNAGIPGTALSPAQPEQMPQKGIQEAVATPSDEQEPNVTPEEQETYEKFILNFHELVFGETGRKRDKSGEPSIFDNVMQSLTSIDDPIEALAQTTVRVVSFLAEEATNAGKPLPPEIILNGALEIIPSLAEFAEALGVKEKYTDNDLSLVLKSAALLYSEELSQSGKLDNQVMQSDADELVRAEKEGRLEEVLPGITQAAEHTPGEIPDDEPSPQAPPTVQQPTPQPQRGMGSAMRPRNG